jgi:hypothetical protein
VFEPITASHGLYSEASHLHVSRGYVLGTRELTMLETLEGILLEAEYVAKLAEANEADEITVTVCR